MTDYKPTHGYFDLTHQPKGMTKKQHVKIQEMQIMLVSEAQKYKDPEVRAANWVAYKGLQCYMAKLQRVIIQSWPHEILFTRESDLIISLGGCRENV